MNHWVNIITVLRMKLYIANLWSIQYYISRAVNMLKLYYQKWHGYVYMCTSKDGHWAIISIRAEREGSGTLPIHWTNRLKVSLVATAIARVNKTSCDEWIKYWHGASTWIATTTFVHVLIHFGITIAAIALSFSYLHKKN